MTLAIHGGTPAFDEILPRWPQFDAEEENALLRALRQGTWWRGEGVEVERFEQEFAAFEQAPFALAVCNGTLALELALLAAQIGSGHRVALPALTFFSTLSAIQRVGATPVVVDVDPRSWNTSTNSLANHVADCAAVIPVHMAGAPCDMAEIFRLADANGASVIQDSAHAVGMRIDGSPPRGTRCFSFQNSKLLSGGEGGAVTFDDRKLYDRAFLIHNCGRGERETSYDHRVIASNFRMNEFSGAVLRTQLQRFPQAAQTRKRGARLLTALLNDIPGIKVASSSGNDVEPSHYMILIELEAELLKRVARDRFVDALRAEGLPANRCYPPVFETKAYWDLPEPGVAAGDLAERCPNSVRLGAAGIWLHHRVLLLDSSGIEKIANGVAKVCLAARSGTMS